MVTIKQFMQLVQAQKTFGSDESRITKEIVNIFNLSEMKKKDADKIMTQISMDLVTEIPFQKTFILDNVEFGFIPNLDDISVGEWVDIDVYQSREEELHKLMAILYRPIVSKTKTSYQIEKYEGTEKYEKIMLNANIQIFNSMMVFFYTLSKELSDVLNIYIQNQKKVK